MAPIEILWLLFSKADNNVQVMLLLDIDMDLGLSFPCICIKKCNLESCYLLEGGF